MDSTMMCIVHNAMNQAHEKMKSKEGVLERLNGISRFYELAAMQLEGCLTFVRQETNSYILDSSHEQVLSDLSDIRDRLQWRLKESEMAIKEKDRELASLRANDRKPVRSKSDPLEEYMVSNRLIVDSDDRDSEFCELKNSVDQQVSHIRQQLEPEYKLEDREGNKKIEHLDSDIGVLKETLDLAFGKMQKAILGSEVGPIEQELGGDVERETMSIVLEGFTRDFQEDVEEHMWNKQEKHVCIGLKEYWSDLMNEVESLRRELEPFTLQNEVPLLGETNDHKSSAEDSGHGIFKKQRSSNAEEVTQEIHEEENKEEEGHLVSKMIKSHESIIRKKSIEAEELNYLKREIFRHKGNLYVRREEDALMKTRIQAVILKLDKLKDWDAKLDETFGSYDNSVREQETPSDKRSPKSHAYCNENLELDTISDVWQKMDKVPFPVNEELQNEELMRKQEQEESSLKDLIMKEIYVTLLEGLVKENYTEICDDELENLIWKDMCEVWFTEVINQWKENTDESYDFEFQTREELFCTVLSEAMNKDYVSSSNFTLPESDDLRAEINLEASIREAISFIILGEMIKEWIQCKEGYETAYLLKLEIEQVVFHETIKDVVYTGSHGLAQHQDIVGRNFFQSTERLIKEDICMVFIRETIEEWKMQLSAFNMESLIREELYQFVIIEAVKDAIMLSREEAESVHREKFSKVKLFANKLHNGRRQLSSPDESLNRKIGSLSSCTDVEEDMMQSESSVIKEHDVNLDIVRLEFEACQLGSKLGTMVSDSVHYEKPFYCQSKANKEAKVNASGSMLTPFLQFSEELVGFQHTTKEKLETNSLRLDDMKYHLNELVEIISSLRKKESLYRDAFSRRCQDLWKAETEVDLLGDQVDLLVGLLEKIYFTLHHHSPVLHQYFEVLEILQLIKKELTGVFNVRI